MKPEKQQKIYGILRSELISCDMTGAYLPSEISLSKRFGCCRETIRGALTMLQNDRFIHSSQGKRTVVNYIPEKSSRTILVINFHSSVLAAAAQANGFILQHISAETLNKMNFGSLNLLLKKYQCCGILCQASHFLGTENICEMLRFVALPVYLIWARLSDFQRVCCGGVYVDLHSGWQLALKTLVECGHSHIASFVPLHINNFHGIDCSEYNSMLKDCGAYVCQEYLFSSGFTNSADRNNPQKHYTEIKSELLRMMSLPNPPTAALCYSNQWAKLLYQAANELRITIPAQLSVMGFVSKMEDLIPQLSSVEFNAQIDFEKIIHELETFCCNGLISPTVTEIPLTVNLRASVRINNVRILNNNQIQHFIKGGENE